jgi:spermidine/putrescine transport system permease protein
MKYKNIVARLYLYLILLFLYIPILTLIIFSFNASKSRAQWDGFTLKWYAELANNPQIIQALLVSISVALLAAVFSTMLGTLAAIGIHSMHGGLRGAIINISYLPVMTPDIVTGVSLMLLFIFFNMKLGFVTMLLAHIAFDVPYVIFSVLPKLKQMNQHAYEAALDLGCTPMQALRMIVLPEIMPGVFTGAVLAFTLSLDDFVVSYFTTNEVQNLSMYVFSAARRGIHPSINALSAIMFVSVLLLLVFINSRSSLVGRTKSDEKTSKGLRQPTL